MVPHAYCLPPGAGPPAHDLCTGHTAALRTLFFQFRKVDLYELGDDLQPLEIQPRFATINRAVVLLVVKQFWEKLVQQEHSELT